MGRKKRKIKLFTAMGGHEFMVTREAFQKAMELSMLLNVNKDDPNLLPGEQIRFLNVPGQGIQMTVTDGEWKALLAVYQKEFC